MNIKQIALTIVTSLICFMAFAAEPSADEFKLTFEDMQKAMEKKAVDIKQSSYKDNQSAVNSAQFIIDSINKIIDEKEDGLYKSWETDSNKAKLSKVKLVMLMRFNLNGLYEWLGGIKYGSEDRWKENTLGFVSIFGQYMGVLADAEKKYQAMATKPAVEPGGVKGDATKQPAK